MRRLAWVATGAATVSLCVLAACVGDDPSSSSGGGVDSGGADTNAVDDGTMPGDAGTDTGDAAGPWTPAVLDTASQLALWLEASSTSFVVSNGKVGTWRDQSKNKNDATNTQSGPTVDTAAVNGHDAVHFAEWGLHLTMTDVPSLRFGNDQVYIVAVARGSAAATGPGFYFSKVTTKVLSGIHYASGLEFFGGKADLDAGGTAIFPGAHVDVNPGNEVVWDAPVFDDGKFHIVAVRRTTASELALTVDDAPVRAAPTGAFDISQPGKDAVLGSIAYGEALALSIDFAIAELVVVHGTTGVVADADVTALRAYLKKKYGL